MANTLFRSLLGSLAGLGQGAGVVGAEREKRRQFDASNAMAQKQLDIQDAERLRKQAEDADTMRLLQQNWAKASSGDLGAQAVLVSRVPALASRFEAPTRAPAQPKLKEVNVVNPLTKTVEDVLDDGTRRYVRAATADEITKATRAPGTGVNGTERQDFQQSQGLSQRYQQNPLVQKAYGVAGSIAGLKAALSGDSPMDDLSTIYETVKLFDPNSAVREGEIKLARSANSLPGQVQLLVDGWRTGKKLTPAMREQIKQLLDRKIQESESTIRPVQADLGAQARRYGVQSDSAYIAPSPFTSFQSYSPDNPFARKR